MMEPVLVNEVVEEGFKQMNEFSLLKLKDHCKIKIDLKKEAEEFLKNICLKLQSHQTITKSRF